DRAAGEGPVHPARRGRRHGLAGRAGHREHRRRHRRPTHYRNPASAGVLRRFGPDTEPVRARHAARVRQTRARRAAGTLRTGPRTGREGSKLAGAGTALRPSPGIGGRPTGSTRPVRGFGVRGASRRIDSPLRGLGPSPRIARSHRGAGRRPCARPHAGRTAPDTVEHAEELSTSMRVVLAGGGTAGHIEPALALADALRRNDPNVGIVCLGTERGLETRLVPQRGYELALIPPVPLPRTLTPQLLSVPGRLRGAINAAAAVLDQAKADILVGFGGYV